jgi:hypothetical protein
MKQRIIEIYGWYGTIAIVGAYTLVSFDWLAADSFWYQFLNGTGAIGVLLVSLSRRAYQPAVLNVVWGLVAFAAIAKMFF